MTQEQLKELNMQELRRLAKEMHIPAPTTHPKATLIEMIMNKQQETATEEAAPSARAAGGGQAVAMEKYSVPIVTVKPARARKEGVREGGAGKEEARPAAFTVVPPVSAKAAEPLRPVAKPAAAEPGKDAAAKPYVHVPVHRAANLNEPRRAGYTIENGAKRPGDGRAFQATNPAANEMLMAGECGDCDGVLEIHADGYGFLRARDKPQNRDVYVSIAQIRRFGLRNGDQVTGKTRPEREGDRSLGLMYIDKINGVDPEIAARRKPFEELVPIFPDRRMRLESGSHTDLAIRAIDLVAPIGFGQRGMIVAPPKAGKTVLLKKIAGAIAQNYPEVTLFVLLIDERPEEVTDMQRSIRGDVVYSTFDQTPEHHVSTAQWVLDRAQRLVEHGNDVVILMDSLTRYARASNLVCTPSGRTLSGGIDPAALQRPKKFFGAARNIEHGGSLTVVATALIDTGSRMDEVIFEEFKGTGNMEVVLDRRLSEKRIFPAIDLARSSTRRDDLLLTPREMEGVEALRKVLSGNNNSESTEQLIGMMLRSRNNDEFIDRIKEWMGIWEKGGYKMG